MFFSGLVLRIKIQKRWTSLTDYVDFCSVLHGLQIAEYSFSRYKVEEQAYKGCLSILKLSDKYSQARLENACKLALSRLSNPTYKNIKLILESGQDEVKRETERMTNKEDTTYAFTRGTEYYGGKK